MPKDASIAASSLAGPCALLHQAGVALADIEELLTALRDDMRSDGAEAMISLSSFVTFLQSAARQHGNGLFGWLAGRDFDLALLGPFGETVLAAPDVRSAIRLFCNAFAVIQSDSVMTLDVRDGEAVVTYRILNPRIWPRAQDAEFTLGIIAALIERAAGPGWRPSSISTEHLPHASEDSYGSEMRCRVVHGAMENTLRFPARLLTLPLAGKDRTEFHGRADVLVSNARMRDRSLPLPLRVRNEIVRGIGHGTCGEADVARSVGLSERSMRRHLSAAGNSYSVILNTCREDMARNLLSVGTLTIEEIATRLDYSDRSAFERSFRRTAGTTPALFRQLICDMPVPAAAAPL